MKFNIDDKIQMNPKTHFDFKNNCLLVVDPETSGNIILEDQESIELVKNLKNKKEYNISDITNKQILQKLFKSSVISINNKQIATGSSSQKNNIEYIIPDKDKNTKPVLCVFHLHNYCNLACQYCYTIDQGVTKKKLSVELMKKAVREFSDFRTNFTTFEFHGGEPTMAFKEIKEVVLYAKEIYQLKGKFCNFSIQTNAFSLNDEIVKFLADFKFSVRVSLDGTEETHNKFRHNLKGFGSYKKVLAGIRKLQSIGISPGAVCVVHKGNIDHMIDMHLSMSQHGLKTIRYLPMFKSPLANNSLWLNGNDFLDGYLKLINYIVDNKEKNPELAGLPNLMLGEINSITSYKREYMCMKSPCGAGSNMISFDVNGKIYPCEEMIGHEVFSIGDLNTDTIEECLNNSTLNQKITSRNVEEIEECSKCTWKQFCHGGCVQKSYAHFKRLDKESEFCSYFKRIYKELIWLNHEKPNAFKYLA
ncbi:MAG: SPASM domain-containing protein [Halobacteriovoraceae bacterium]|nr:SPASM domain-containing protein [Halobacteriovoraceae bacterium]